MFSWSFSVPDDCFYARSGWWWDSFEAVFMRSLLSSVVKLVHLYLLLNLQWSSVILFGCLFQCQNFQVLFRNEEHCLILSSLKKILFPDFAFFPFLILCPYLNVHNSVSFWSFQNHFNTTLLDDVYWECKYSSTSRGIHLLLRLTPQAFNQW